MMKAACLTLALAILGCALAEEDGIVKPPHTTPKPPPLPVCGDAKNCFDCFLEQECVPNPLGGDPLCTPCGWCAHRSNNSWTKDIKGTCVMAPIGAVDFCQFVDPGADRYCPESVCKVGEWDCNCKDNVCPMVEHLIDIFSVEGLWAIIIGVLCIGMCLLGACCYSVLRRVPPERIIVVSLDPVNSGPGPGTGTQGSGAPYARFA